eukprot:PhF_6_TR25412/c0_g1_i2/m.35128
MLLRAKLVVVLLVCSVLVDADVPRPRELTFVAPCDRVYIGTQTEIFAGVNAAFMEANADNQMGGTKLRTKQLDFTTEVALSLLYDYSAPLLTTLGGLLQDDNVTGILANTQYIGYVLTPLLASVDTTPAFGLATVKDGYLDSPHIVNLRGFANFELPLILEFAIMREGLHCTSFLFLNIYLPNVSTLTTYMLNNGFGTVLNVERAVLGVYNATEINERLAEVQPSCLYIVDYGEQLTKLVEILHTLPAFVKGTPIVATSVG